MSYWAWDILLGLGHLIGPGISHGGRDISFNRHPIAGHCTSYVSLGLEHLIGHVTIGHLIWPTTVGHLIWHDMSQ